MINAMLRGGAEIPIHLKPEDIEVQRTRNTPKCATVVIMDMSGSMRYDGQYVHVKRMALALNGLIRSEYPGDYLNFVGIAMLAGLTIVCYIAIMPALKRKKDMPYLIIAILEVAVLVLAASGILKAGH